MSEVINHVLAYPDKIEEAAVLLSALRTPRIDGTKHPIVALPSSISLHSLEQFQENPLRVKENLTFNDVASFLGYLKQFRVGYHPQLFAHRTDAGLRIDAVLDYHQATNEAVTPNWGTYRASLVLDFHPDFIAWQSHNGRQHGQMEFADFIEEYTHRFIQPDGATMLEIAQDLSGHRNVQWASGQRLGNGQVRIDYNEQISGSTRKGEVNVPERFTIMLPVFSHLAPKQLEAALRWRLGDDKKISFAFKFLRLLDVLEEAFDEVVETVENDTALPVFYLGKPKG